MNTSRDGSAKHTSFIDDVDEDFYLKEDDEDEGDEEEPDHYYLTLGSPHK